jgi:hypothetical protein
MRATVEEDEAARKTHSSPPCTIPTKGTHSLRIPTSRWFYYWFGSRLVLSQPGAGDWNRSVVAESTRPYFAPAKARDNHRAVGPYSEELLRTFYVDLNIRHGLGLFSH